MSNPALELRQVERTYQQGDVPLHVFRGASLTIRPGELVALVGPSGAGKSSLLHIAGLLEKPDAGEVLVTGANGGVGSVAIAVLLDKRTRRSAKTPLDADFTGFECPDHFVVGYGMDVGHAFRELPFVGVVTGDA